MNVRRSLNPLWCSALLVGAAAVVLSCREPAPAGPDLRVPTLEASQGNSPTGLLQCRPLAYDSVTQMIGRTGAVLRVSKHTLSIPRLALTRPVKITVVVPSDTVNVIRFQPEGLVFDAPVTLTMSYVNCSTGASTDPRQIAYVDSSLTAVEYEPSVDDAWGRKVTSTLTHFSGYAVSW
jgi:hypothetical protein